MTVVGHEGLADIVVFKDKLLQDFEGDGNVLKVTSFQGLLDRCYEHGKDGK